MKCPSLRGAACIVFVAWLATVSAAQLNGAYTIDPNGSGPTNYTTWKAATWDLSLHGISGPVTFTVASATFNESVSLPLVTGSSATNSVTFVAKGSPAIINGGANVALSLNSSRFMILQNLHFDCTGTYCMYGNQSDDNTLINCKFSGGGQVVYSQGMDRTLFDSCELDGKGTATRLLSPYNANDSDCRFQNCLMHSCSPSGIGAYIDVSGYGIMFWNNTIIVTTSQTAVKLGCCCAWSRANSFRNNIVVNLGTGTCIKYGRVVNSNTLDYNDIDHNCYYAPNGNACELENGTTFSKGTLAQWKAYYTANRATIVPLSGTPPLPTATQVRWDDNSIEADPLLTSMTVPYDIHLKPGSPCQDTGTSVFVAGPWVSYSATATVPTDFEGETRGNLIDIGADEVAVKLTGSGSGNPGTALTFSLYAGSDAGRPYQVGTALGSGPIPIGKRLLGLSADTILVASTGGTLPTIFVAYSGTLDKAGAATAKLNIPKIGALRGIRLYTAFLSLNPSSPLGVSNISNTFMFSVQ